MSYFTDKLIDGLLGGNYICDECGSKMEFEDSTEDTLVCPNCGYSTDLDEYGQDDDSDDYSQEVIYPEDLWSDEEDDIKINLYAEDEDDDDDDDYDDEY